MHQYKIYSYDTEVLFHTNNARELSYTACFGLHKSLSMLITGIILLLLIFQHMDFYTSKLLCSNYLSFNSCGYINSVNVLKGAQNIGPKQ